MKRRAPIALAGLVVALVAAQGCHRHAAPPLGLVIGAGGPVDFPPSDDEWSERKPLPPASSATTLRADPALHVTAPELDDKGHFENKGQIVRLAFNESVIDLGDLKKTKRKAPSIVITPSVPGHTVWSYGSEVEFRAEKPFDPDTEYSLELPELTSPSGKKLAGGFKATFKAEPIVEVAGKTITYIPKPGRARPVAISPSDDSMLGGAQAVTLVYDQPIDLALAAKLVTVKRPAPDGQKTSDTVLVPSVLSHPGRRAFEGQKIDPRFVLLVQPAPLLKGGERFTVEARSQNDADESRSQDYRIAEATKLVEVRCSGDDCDAKDRTVRGGSGTSIGVHFSNPLGLGYNDGKKHVHISPAPKNLYVSGWDELGISASFAPSTTYTIQTEGLHDRYGGAVPPVTVTFVSRPLPASATMSEGVALLDEAATRSFPVTTRNVEKGELALWALPRGDVAAYAKALKDVRAWTPPPGEPAVVSFTPPKRRDENVETALDLGSKVERGRAYVAQVRIGKAVDGAVISSYPAGSPASRPSMAVVFPTGESALAAHVHQAGEKSIVQVFRLGSGQPVPGAHVAIGAASGTTDAGGTVLLATGPAASAAATAPGPGTGAGDDPVLAVSTSDAELLMPLDGSSVASRSLFPELSAAEGASDQHLAPDAVGMLVTDRGIYRPGSKMSVKGFVRRVHDASIAMLPNAKVRLRVVDPMGTDVADEVLVTNARGAIAREVSFAKGSHTGRFVVRLELDDGKHSLLASDMVRVADFETPRFKVDVEPDPPTAPAPAAGGSRALKARIVGRYLFGAPMGGAHATWVIKKSRVPVKGGALADAGLAFGTEHAWWEDTPSTEALRPVTGEGVLGEDGVLPVDAVTGPLADGPTELVLEADVSDASNRHVSGLFRTVEDPYAHHAGLRLSRRFGDAGQPLRIELGAIDAQGHVAEGLEVTARLERLTWTRAAEKAESGATLEHWKYVARKEADCKVLSGPKPVACELPVPHGGDFRVVARVDGRDDSSTSFWAYGGWVSGVREGVPSQGKKVPLVLDKARYRNGETAKLLVQSPFAKATALVTYEQGGIVRHETKLVSGPSGTIDVPVSAANAPWVHAVVTLLPIGESEADYRVAAVRIPVTSDDAKLEVRVASGKKSYEVRDEAEITIEVKRAGVAVKNADVTLGVVDEGVLRMTAYHPKDPVAALRPGRDLDFRIADSRASMLRRREKAHTAGGGDSEGEESLDTRKNFVETAAWLPDLVTDGEGRVKVKVKLPDNLTELRMTAVALDDAGGGGTAESSFVVTRPLFLEPIMPRFALRGDRFLAAAMVHNNNDVPVAAEVTLAGEKRDVIVAAHGRARVAVEMTESRAGLRTLVFALNVGTKLEDRVEVPFRVDEPGIDEHPMASGVFGERQEVHLAIPGDAVFEEGAALSIKTGSALYPELGQRLSYLLDYPHGCVEQTTSSTIPLLAARTILPWTGTSKLSDEELRKRIDAGVARLATMQTSSGGLAYWPGGSEPNLYGSAYAMRALLRAKELGIERPKLVEGVTRFLVAHLGDEREPELRMSIAEVLAMAGELPSSAGDSLYDMREKLDSSGLASLALALSVLPKQEDRVRDVLDRLESSFDDKGAPAKAHDKRDWHTWGSEDRDRAQATIALVKLRKTSRVLPVLAERLSKTLDSYSTQSTAWSLMALADYVGTRSPEGGVDVSVRLLGKILDTFTHLGGDNKEVRIPLKDLAGKKVTLLLGGDPQTPSAYALEARYKRPLEAGGTRLARRAARGVSIHRAYSDAAGKVVNLNEVKPGQIVRVALRIDMPQLDAYRLGYLAVTDRLPAGFEALNTDLATTGSLPELSKDHPFFEGLSEYGSAESHVDLRDDRVQIYFDRVYSGHAVYASYLTRAVTAGTFTLPPASAELMYEAGSEGYSDATRVTVK
jgi:uncharacterized protein YfaS (alpha-2-macroglobulin family)